MPGHIDGERQADIAEPNDPDPDVMEVHQGHRISNQRISNRDANGSRKAANLKATQKLPTPRSSNAHLQGSRPRQQYEGSGLGEISFLYRLARDQARYGTD
jgi:hypothetical protein